MLDLSSYTGLSLQFDTKKNKLLIDANNTTFCSENNFKLEDLKPTLLNRILIYPEYIYTEYRKIYNCCDKEKFENTKLKHNLIMIPPNLLGIEYAKTHCYTSPLRTPTKSACILECIYGVMTVLIQVRKPRGAENECEVFESALIKAKKILSNYIE